MAVKARIEKLMPPEAASFIYKIRREPRFGVFWHYHPEYQLTLILRGRGKQFVGDEISPFKPGDLVLTGPNLPHMWCSARRPRRGGRPHEAIMIQFPESIFGGHFLELPEMKPVRRLLARSAQGIRFDGTLRRNVAGKIIRMQNLRGLARLIGLLEILRRLSQDAGGELLSSTSYSARILIADRERIDRICRHAAEHAAGPLGLSEAARAAHMSVPAFTRFFKRCTGKTFAEYRADLRIGMACRLLLESDRTVAEVSRASGFSNLSTFNRRFRALKGRTPREFRSEFSS